MPQPSPWFSSPADAADRLGGSGYLADAATATTAYLAGALEKPLLVEGPAGVGKTELAKAVARVTGADLVRLQCYEGLDEARALYEWNYKKQLLRIQATGEQSCRSRTWSTCDGWSSTGKPAYPPAGASGTVCAAHPATATDPTSVTFTAARASRAERGSRCGMGPPVPVSPGASWPQSPTRPWRR